MRTVKAKIENDKIAIVKTKTRYIAHPVMLIMKETGEVVYVGSSKTAAKKHDHRMAWIRFVIDKNCTNVQITRRLEKMEYTITCPDNYTTAMVINSLTNQDESITKKLLDIHPDMACNITSRVSFI